MASVAAGTVRNNVVPTCDAALKSLFFLSALIKKTV
jgi:hypothetical protein